jgi:uncharacterized spore protein YtfJ
MIAAELLKTIGERFQSSATVKNVYGDPITIGDRTVIPVARISYAFGGGGGTSEAEQIPGGGGGGGGRVSAVPAGYIEITSAGTRFIRIWDWRMLGSLVAISAALGFFIGTRRRRYTFAPDKRA